MQITEYLNPIPYLVIDDFLTKGEFAYTAELCASLFYLSNYGKHGDVYEDNLLRRNEFYVEQNLETPEVATLQAIIRSNVWSDYMRSVYRDISYPLKMIEATTKEGMLLGYYSDKGYYSLHKDTSFLTFQLFTHENKTFEGGDFLLTDAMQKKDATVKARIEAKPNRAVIFPSCYYHGVDQVKCKSHNVEDMRISLQYFLTFKET